ncbi:MAG: dephospho-CoA kinase [Acidimicrobiaceae bacterium]|nr:dephospho-CoA kinase [Acidimicrobiaceae bacterium]|tara:strand:+ start:705 stop:1337 length:633 start_codon:yes stop_codon:yes gene_type:complete
MTEFAITGGIGSGKTTVAKLLVLKGATLIDADQIVRDLQKPGQSVYKSIVERFGSDVVTDNQELDRQKIADIVFSNPEQLEALNTIVHPAVGEEMGALRRKFAATNAIVLIDIPLLVTPEGELARKEYKALQGKIVVDCEIETAISRLVAFRGFNEQDATARISKQSTRKQRLEFADYVIDNNGEEENLIDQIDACWVWMQSLAKEIPSH